MIFRKKRIVAKRRTEDTVPFVIPEIEDENKKKGYEHDHFVSPIFGRSTKDDVVIPNPHKHQGDLDKQLDPFRTKPKLTKEKMKEKYGSEFPEFDLVSGRNLNEAMKSHGRKKVRPNDPVREEPVTAYKEEIVYEKPEKIEDQQIEKPKTNINEFFGKQQQVRKETFVYDVPKEESDVEVKTLKKEYKFPPFSLLSKPLAKSKDNHEWLQKQIDILDKLFEDFKIEASVKTYTKGPTVTRYEIELESGVNIKKITGISDNIKMALAAKEIRMEAPIPGKSTVGIEVPNEIADIVNFIDIVNQDEFKYSNNPLTVALGLDIDGLGVYTSISRMPHGLVAGATGSGKSVCINTILMSLLFKYSPDHLKLMLIDPKMVELTSYNGLPHLITPVITDAKIATAGLKWAVDEMERRFIMFSNERVRDIKAFNDKARREDRLTNMPYIVIIVDELADLMMVASSSVEEAIMRLTQKARACGIHLIIATQRPSTDVVKGTIKSNIPTRIAFMVSSYIDSMTIIDGAGADKLLGRGDMLFAEAGKPHRRVQGAYISDSEIHNVNEFIRRQRSEEYYFDQKKLVQKVTNVDNSDELLAEVATYVVTRKEASINKISKEFKIGFNRAQKIVEMLCELGIVSDNVGSKARDVLVTQNELESLLNES